MNRPSLTEESLKQVNEFRFKQGMPAVTATSATKGIFNRMNTKDVIELFTDREVAVLNTIFEMYQKDTGGIPDGLTVNVNESLKRKPWAIDCIMNMSCRAKLYHHGSRSLLNVGTLFQ
eukprot:9088196-Pyramimonas_sp.AAC.1